MSKYVFLGMLLATGVANAGFFGPSDYNECVIDGLKNLKSKDLAPGIYSACRSKFPEKETREDRESAAKKSALLRKCGLSETDDYQKFMFMADRYPQLGRYIVGLKSISMQYLTYQTTVSFQNNNNIGISAVAVGFGLAKSKGNSCSYSAEDYKAVLYCNAIDTKMGVSAKTYGTLSCDQNAAKFSKDSYCIIGLSPMYDRFSTGTAAIMDEMGLCK